MKEEQKVFLKRILCLARSLIHINKALGLLPSIDRDFRTPCQVLFGYKDTRWKVVSWGSQLAHLVHTPSITKCLG